MNREVLQISLNAIGSALPSLTMTEEMMVPNNAELRIVSESAGIELVAGAGECIVWDESIETSDEEAHPLTRMVTSNMCI